MLAGIAASFQALLDNHQIPGTALEPFKCSLVELNAVIAMGDEPAQGEPAEVPSITVDPEAIAKTISDKLKTEGFDMATKLFMLVGNIKDSLSDISKQLVDLRTAYEELNAAPSATTVPAATAAAPAAAPAGQAAA